MDVFLQGLLKKALEYGERLKELEYLLGAPEVMSHPAYYRKLSEEAYEIQEIAASGERLKGYADALEKTENTQYSDAELRKLQEEEKASLEENILAERKFLSDLLGKLNSTDSNYAILTINASKFPAFGRSLYEMYIGYAKRQNFSVEEKSESSKKNLTLTIRGENAFGKLKSENGTHKAFGRVPKVKESVFVTVLPEIEKRAIIIEESDMRVDIFHSSGAGGQNVNKVETAVRITHLNTGISAVCQDERSQLKNKEQAMKLLQEKVQAHYAERSAIEREKQKKQAAKSDYERVYDFTAMEVRDNKTELALPLVDVLQGEGIDLFYQSLMIKNLR